MRDAVGAAQRPTGSRHTGGDAVGAAASVAVRETLRGPPRRGRVLAAFPSAVYVTAGSDVVALVTADGVRLPNALVVAANAAAAPFPGVAVGDPVLVGAGCVDVGGVEVRVGRWWDPRPSLGVVDPAVLAANAAAASGMGAPAPGSAALRSRVEAFEQACEPGSAAAAAARLVGLGDGLTPAGDDLLAGTLAGWRLFGEAVGGAVRGRTRALAGGTFAALDLREGTTALSGALLRHAAAGEVAAPVACACRALVGRGPLEPAMTALRDIGHTSGGWLLRGLLVAGRTCRPSAATPAGSGPAGSGGRSSRPTAAGFGVMCP